MTFQIGISERKNWEIWKYGKQGITCKHGRNKSDDLWEYFEYYITIWKLSM